MLAGGGVNVGGPSMSMDDVVVGLQIHPQLHGQQTHPNSPPPDMTLGKGLQSLFGMHTPLSSRSPSVANLANRSQRTGRSPEPMRSSNSGGSLLRQSPHVAQQQQQHQHQTHQPTQPATLFPAQLMLSSSTSSAITSASPSSHNQVLITTYPIPRATISGECLPLPSPPGTQTWTNSNSITSNDFYNVPYLDLHYTYGGVGMGPANMAPAFNDPSDTRQGQEALDLAQPAALASSSLNLSNLGLNLAFGTGNKTQTAFFLAYFHDSTASSSSTGMALNKQSQPPSDTFGSVAAAIAAANAVGQSSCRESSGINALDLNGSGTIRQSHFKSANPSLGRSMSHHRGQSAVCPQDLDLSHNDGIKRKRASWDGGLV
jgi:hypothetical protein